MGSSALTVFDGEPSIAPAALAISHCIKTERLFIKLLTSDRKLEASRQDSK